jgi:hypothetical protein
MKPTQKDALKLAIIGLCSYDESVIEVFGPEKLKSMIMEIAEKYKSRLNENAVVLIKEARGE